jgi:hypothetical protein
MSLGLLTTLSRKNLTDQSGFHLLQPLSQVTILETFSKKMSVATSQILELQPARKLLAAPKITDTLLLSLLTKTLSQGLLN